MTTDFHRAVQPKHRFHNEHPHFLVEFQRSCDKSFIIDKRSGARNGNTFVFSGEHERSCVPYGQRHLSLSIETGDGTDGGTRGFSLRCWDVVEEIHTDDKVGLVMEITSPDGEGGYPGNVKVRATLTLDNANVWRIGWEATTDQATPLSLTEHAYWNLNGAASGTTIMDHTMQISADRFTPYNVGMIPTGELRSVEGTPFDFRQPHAIGANHDADDDCLKYGAGYDINWVVNGWDGTTLRHACTLASAATGRKLEVWTTEPGMQVYDGYYLPVRNSGVALETQHFPDSPNKPEFPTTIVQPGQTLRTATEYRFSAS